MLVRKGRFFPPEIGHLVECKLINTSNRSLAQRGFGFFYRENLGSGGCFF